MHKKQARCEYVTFLKKKRQSTSTNQQQRMQLRIKMLKTEMKGKERQRSYKKLGKTKSSSSPWVMTCLVQTKGKRGSTARSIVREKLYKSSLQKAKETLLRIKMMETGLANKIEEKRVMAESLIANKVDAAETEAEYRLLKMRRNELMEEWIGGINDFLRLREMESLLMGFL